VTGAQTAQSEPFAGKSALVTGGSRNLGATIAERLAVCGASVAINYQTSARTADGLVKRLTDQTGRPHFAFRGDMARADEVRDVVHAAEEQLGRVDILVNNAGPFSMTPFSELPESEWDRIWNANVKAAYIASQLMAPAMRAEGFGRIVNISAVSSVLRNHSIYGLAKSALLFLTEELATELGPEITVNAVAPGQILESAADIAEFDPTFVERAIAATPAGRLVTRDEVADVVIDLCRPDRSGLTGVVVPVDGGFRLRSF
jgi:NAD(P)-dependent dehydrogenase (short-subunit alcohol dehydrogenase family)